jgi:CRP-like cAMP-binding protein
LSIKTGWFVNSLPNGLIAQLAPLDQALLLRNAQLIRFKAGDVLAVPHLETPHIYFLTRGSVALFVGKKPKDIHTGLAVGLVGAEGALDLQLALNLGLSSLTFIAQSPGTAYAVDASLAQRLVRRKAALLLTFARYLWTEYESVANLAALSHTQDIRKRLAHWLLLSAQRCAPDALMLTHAHIAHMLGVRRASISMAARDMKMAGLIDYSRGHLQLKKPEALQRLACG